MKSMRRVEEIYILAFDLIWNISCSLLLFVFTEAPAGNFLQFVLCDFISCFWQKITCQSNWALQILFDFFYSLCNLLFLFYWLFMFSYLHFSYSVFFNLFPFPSFCSIHFIIVDLFLTTHCVLFIYFPFPSSFCSVLFIHILPFVLFKRFFFILSSFCSLFTTFLCFSFCYVYDDHFIVFCMMIPSFCQTYSIFMTP